MSRPTDILDNFHTKKADILDIHKVNRKMFHPHRMQIMKNLYLMDVVEFKELKHSLDLSDGNLSSHLRALISENLIVMQKRIVDNSFRTYYKLTQVGKDEFIRLAENMKGFFDVIEI